MIRKSKKMPVLTEPIVGYRLFYADFNNFELRPLVRIAEPYVSGQIMNAKCGGKSFIHNKGATMCQCGIYSFKELDYALNTYYCAAKQLYLVTDVDAWVDGPPKPIVNRNHGSLFYLILAKVLFWGQVHEHEKGHRGEFMYPSIFYYLHNDYTHLNYKIKIQQLANAWGVETADA